MEGQLIFFYPCSATQLIADGLFIGEIEKLPLTATLGAAVIVTVLFLPSLVVVGSIPDDLGVGTHQVVLAPAFQLFTV